LSILERLPANRDPISVAVAGSDKTPGLLLINTRFSAARWELPTGEIRGQRRLALAEGKAAIAPLLIDGSTAIYMIVIGILVLNPISSDSKSRI
jgi:hypothetical protein